jgi:hypothetical protein
MNPRIVVAKTTAISVASRWEMLLVLLMSGVAGTIAYILLALLVSNGDDTLLPLLPFRGPHIRGSYALRISMAQISVVNTFKTIKTSNSASYPGPDISKILLHELIFKALE